MRYQAFLSYSHRDAAVAKWLHRRLERYRPPKNLNLPRSEALGPVFRDREELASASSLSDAVANALTESNSLIVVCSPDAAQSKWVNEEIRQFRRLGRDHRVFCFIVRGDPTPGSANCCFPPALLEAAHSQPPPEPIAADARSVGDGKRDAFLKLAAGMLEIGFDALKQRDLRRRNRRLALATTASLAMLGLTILLLINAVLATQEAEKRRRDAEDLVDFMLGDLQEELRAIGRLDVFISVGSKAFEYFATQDDNDEVAIGQRARNLRQIGEVHLELGKFDDALLAFRESYELTSQLAERTPEDLNAQIALANSVFYVGHVHWQRGELDSAADRFRDAVFITRDVRTKDPANPEWLMEDAYANTNLGRVLERQGELTKAADAYEEVLAINETLTSRFPDNDEWRLELAFAYNNVGKVAVALGDLSQARTSFEFDYNIKRDLLLLQPDHEYYRSHVAISAYFLALTLNLNGDYAEAEKLLRDALDHWDHLIDIEQNRLRWQARRARVEQELALALAHLGRPDDASAFVASSLVVLDRLAGTDNIEFRRDLARSLVLAAEVGGTEATDSSLRRAESIVDELLGHEPNNPENLRLQLRTMTCRREIAPMSISDAEVMAARDSLRASKDPRVRWLEHRSLNPARSESPEPITSEIFQELRCESAQEPLG